MQTAPAGPPAAPPPGLRPCPTLTRMLRLAGARQSDRICVSGPASYAALLALCRLGFEAAVRVCGPGCRCAEPACDVVLVTGPCEAAALDDLIADASAYVRDGGVLVVHEAGLTDDERVRTLLAQGGRETGWCVHDLSQGCLVAFQVLGRRPAAFAEACAA